MKRKYYAMDTCFYNELGDYPLAQRCEMLKELGFYGSYLTLWDIKQQPWIDAREIAEVSSRNGLEVAGIYATLDLEDVTVRDRVLELVPLLPEGCAIEVSLKSGKEAFKNSSEDGDEAALHLLQPLLDAVDPGRNDICLYAHIYQWLEHHQDALRLVNKSGHPSLGWVFSAYHWYATQEGNLFSLLDRGLPSLRRVNFCGSRRSTDGSYTLEPLNSGSLDLSVIFGQIAKRGYAGPIGIQGFGIGGDVYVHLRNGMDLLKDWDQRFERHPTWADILPTPLPWFCAPKKDPLLLS
jgi:sugar phosphate isomerase/epimerase